MKKQSALNKVAAIAVLTILAGFASGEARASSEAPTGQLKLSQMSLESTQCPFTSVAKSSIGEEQKPATPAKASTQAISIAAE